MSWTSQVQVAILYVVPVTTEPGTSQRPCSHHHAQGSISDVNYGPEPCQCGPALTFPVSCLCLQVQRSSAKLSFRHCVLACAWRPLPTRSKFNSLLTEMITPQTYNLSLVYSRLAQAHPELYSHPQHAHLRIWHVHTQDPGNHSYPVTTLVMENLMWSARPLKRLVVSKSYSLHQLNLRCLTLISPPHMLSQ